MSYDVEAEAEQTLYNINTKIGHNRFGAGSVKPSEAEQCRYRNNNCESIGYFKALNGNRYITRRSVRDSSTPVA